MVFVIAFIDPHGDPASGYNCHWQGDIEEKFHSSHLNPPRVRLASKCNATAAESQITVPIAVLTDIAGEPDIWLAMLAAGAISPATTHAVEALSREFASSFVRSLCISVMWWLLCSLMG
jgi:hypothetical protein